MNEKHGSNDDRVRELTAQLATSEARLHSVIEHSPDAFVIVDETGVITFVNSAAAALIGVDKIRLVGRLFGLPLIAGETTDVDIVSRHGPALIAEMRVLKTEWDGKRAQLAVLRDVTERRRAEQALRENEKRLTLAMEVAKLSFWDIDLRTGRVIDDEKLLDALGYRRSEIEPTRQAWEALLHTEDLPRVQQALEAHLQGVTRVYRQQFRMRTKTGEWRWILAQGEVVERAPAGDPLRVIGVSEDITVRRETEERLRQLSQLDPLTRLPNRGLLYEFAEHLLSSATRDGTLTAFLFVDLDRFKPINDTYGHGVGDAVLKEVAKRLNESVRGGDLAARLGGDEFMVVLGNLHNEEDAAKAARHALKSLGRPYEINGLSLIVTPSIGISLFPQDGERIDDLIKNADVAMYQAKEGGKNDFQFFRQMFNERAHEALRLESRLREGLARHEFTLFYQPVVDTETNAVVSAEALLRWPVMDAGPDIFIPVAEKAGFMRTLGNWVLTEACRQQREWHDRGLPSFPLAVNVSPIEFRQKHFAESVGAALEESGLSAGDLCMEVTESAVMRDVDEAAAVLRALHGMGIKVALDDFGTGYSSLSYLSRLPIDTLKLDQSFIKGIGHKGADTAITEGIIGLGRSLGLDVIAEGVESAAALDFLRGHRCRHCQGFYFCRPMPANEFEQWYGRRPHSAH